MPCPPLVQPHLRLIFQDTSLFAPIEPWRGVFARVVRLNEDGSQYIDPSRDPNHPSEAELDGVPADFTLEAQSGGLQTLKNRTADFLDEIDEKW